MKPLRAILREYFDYSAGKSISWPLFIRHKQTNRLYFYTGMSSNSDRQWVVGYDNKYEEIEFLEDELTKAIGPGGAYEAIQPKNARQQEFLYGHPVYPGHMGEGINLKEAAEYTDPNSPDVRSVLIAALKPLGATSFVKKGATTEIRAAEWYATVWPGGDTNKMRQKWLKIIGYWNRGPVSKDNKTLADKLETALRGAGARTEREHTFTNEFSFNVFRQDPSVDPRTGYKLKAMPPEVVKAFDRKGFKDGVCQVKFGREFIERSFALAKDSSDLQQLSRTGNYKGMATYEMASPEIFYDADEAIFWMNTGSFD